MEITQCLNVKLYSYQKTRQTLMWAVKVTIPGVFLTFGECYRDSAPTLDAYWAHARSYELIHRSFSVFSEAGIQFELKPVGVEASMATRTFLWWRVTNTHLSSLGNIHPCNAQSVCWLWLSLINFVSCINHAWEPPKVASGSCTSEHKVYGLFPYTVQEWVMSLSVHRFLHGFPQRFPT